MHKRSVVGVCHGPRCADYGGRVLATELMQQDIEVEALDCQSLCQHGPIARMDGGICHHASLEQVLCRLID